MLIEWAERVADCLPRERLEIRIERQPANEQRRFESVAAPSAARIERRDRSALQE